MKWSELPKEYQNLEIPEVAKKVNDPDSDDLNSKFKWRYTNEGYIFWQQCHGAKKIHELPPIPIKEMKDFVTETTVNLAEKLHEAFFTERLEKDVEKKPNNLFYMVYVDGATGSNVKHDYKSAQEEAERLLNNTSQKVYILKTVLSFEREVIIKKNLL